MATQLFPLGATAIDVPKNIALEDSPISSAKPDNGIEVEVLVPNDSISIGGKVDASLKLNNRLDDVTLKIELEAPNQIKLTSNIIKLHMNKNEESVMPVSFVPTTEGEFTVKAKITATDANGNSTGLIREINTLVTKNEVYVSNNGFDDLRLKDLKNKKQKGLISDDDYKIQEKIVKRGNAKVVSKMTTDAKKTTSQNITVSGHVAWTDSAGNVHPARLVPVEICDDDVLFDDIITTTATNEDGDYSVTVKNDNGLTEQGYDIFARFKTEGQGFEIKTEGLFGGVIGIDTDTRANVANGSTVIENITFNNSANTNTAFSVHQCMVLANQFVEDANGGSMDKVTINYPTSEKTSFLSLSNEEIYLLRLDRFDWDVILHEYGHYVQLQLGTSNSPGKEHWSGENLSDRLSKEDAVRLAWGEGWATYFGIAAQLNEDASDLGVPNVGDAIYQDTEDAEITDNLETANGSARGEDNELSVSRVLFDLNDGANEANDAVSMDYRTLWNKIDANNCTTLSDAVNAITAGMTDKQIADIGGILTAHKIAPSPNKPANGTNINSATIPTFSWTANGDANLKNNSFVVEFYDSAFSTKLLESPVLATTSYKPSASEWKNIFGHYDRKIYWVVRAYQTDSPTTGPYVSKPMLLNKASALDLVFLIDTTGSMADDISNVKSSVSTIVDTISSESKNYRLAIATYRDFPESPYGDPGDYVYKANCAFTDDKSQIVAAVNSLNAGGGNDWKESVYSALMNAISSKDIGGWRSDAERIIIVMGDAPPHDPEPHTGYTLGSVIAAANKASVITSTESTQPTASIVEPATFSESKADGEYVIDDGDGGEDIIEDDSADYGSIRIFPIMIGSDSETRYIFNSLATGTEGQMFSAPTASMVSAAILEIIESVTEDIGSNTAPDISGAMADQDVLWSPNNKMVPITIQNVIDPDGDDVVITITSVTQDEPLTVEGEVDATGLGSDIVYLRTARSGEGNGRVYRIGFQAADGAGAISEGYVFVTVPHDQGVNTPVIDDGQLFNSTSLN